MVAIDGYCSAKNTENITKCLVIDRVRFCVCEYLCRQANCGIAKELMLWQNFYTYYVDEYRLDQLHILRYEKLKLNLGLEMKKVLNFLGLDFDKNVEFCVMQKQKGSFKRPKSSINYKQFFTKAQNNTIEASKKIVYSRLGLTELTEQIENKEN